MPDRMSPAAIGLTRLDLPVRDIDLYELAQRYGYRMVYQVKTDIAPVLAIHALARHAAEVRAEAVVVPGFEHADEFRHLVTENAALITPVQIYPRGYRWPGTDLEGGSS